MFPMFSFDLKMDYMGRFYICMYIIKAKSVRVLQKLARQIETFATCKSKALRELPPPMSNTYSILHIELCLCLLIGSLALLQIENVN
jgi:hypothetical protein